MKKFQIYLSYELEYIDTISAESLEEAAIKVMDKVRVRGATIRPHTGTITVKEVRE